MINVGAAALVAALLVAAYIIRRLRLRQTQRQMREFLAEYFNGDLPLDHSSGERETSRAGAS